MLPERSGQAPPHSAEGDGSSDLIVGEFLSPHNAALMEAGKQMLLESVSLGREFLKDMIGVTAAAIGVYTGLLAFALPEKYRPSIFQMPFVIAPVALFLTAITIFAIGYFPQTGELSVELPATIERERVTAIKSRRRHAFWGLSCFGVGVLTALYVVVLASTWSRTDTQTPMKSPAPSTIGRAP